MATSSRMSRPFPKIPRPDLAINRTRRCTDSPRRVTAHRGLSHRRTLNIPKIAWREWVAKQGERRGPSRDTVLPSDVASEAALPDLAFQRIAFFGPCPCALGSKIRYSRP